MAEQYITGSLPYDRHLTRPLRIDVEWDEFNWLVSEPEFNMHAVGPTAEEAVEHFRAIFSGYVDVLTERERTLGPALTAQLTYLRSYTSND